MQSVGSAWTEFVPRSIVTGRTISVTKWCTVQGVVTSPGLIVQRMNNAAIQMLLSVCRSMMSVRWVKSIMCWFHAARIQGRLLPLSLQDVGYENPVLTQAHNCLAPQILEWEVIWGERLFEGLPIFRFLLIERVLIWGLSLHNRSSWKQALFHLVILNT